MNAVFGGDLDFLALEMGVPLNLYGDTIIQRSNLLFNVVRSCTQKAAENMHSNHKENYFK